MVRAGKIGIEEHGSVNFDLKHGYNTMWWHFSKLNKEIDQDEFNRQVGIEVVASEFSYAELPKTYSCILGVTGTLKSLGTFERKIVQEEYCITQETFTPSVFGTRFANFHEGVHVEAGKEDYFQKIAHDITLKVQSGRAVLVFVEDEKRLREFVESPYGQTLKNQGKGVCEVTHGDLEHIDHCVRQATHSGQVTVFVRTFARGQDFVSHDRRVNGNGGVHVIQTFLSEEKSEEIQCQGRTCRQGDAGTYRLILLKDDLLQWNERKNMPGLPPLFTEKEITDVQNRAGDWRILYELLDSKRLSWFNDRSEHRLANVRHAKKQHQLSLQFQSDLHDASAAARRRAFEFLTSIASASAAASPSNGSERGVVQVCYLMDATGSMGPYIDVAKDTVKSLIHELSSSSGIHTFEFAFVAYRDFDQGDTSIEEKDFTTVADIGQLEQFIGTIKARGGDDGPEDVAGGLEKALSLGWKRDNTVPIIILITDCPAHGSRFTGGIMEDKYPSGSSKYPRPTLQSLVEQMAARGIAFCLAQVNEKHTRVMANALQTIYNKSEEEKHPPMQVVDMSNLQDLFKKGDLLKNRFQQTMHDIVQKSMYRYSAASTGRSKV